MSTGGLITEMPHGWADRGTGPRPVRWASDGDVRPLPAAGILATVRQAERPPASRPRLACRSASISSSPSGSACRAGPPRRRCATAGSTSAASAATSPGARSSPATAVEFFPNRPKARTVASRLRVLHEDRHVLVVDKPAGLLTLPTPDRERDTLIDRAGRYLAIRHGGRGRSSGSSTGSTRTPRAPWPWPARPRPSARFQALFKAHDIERQYLAVVEGRVRLRRGHDRPGPGDRPRRPPPRASPAARARGGPRSPITASSSGSARSPPSSPAGSRPAGPTRSASTWPRSATPSSATPSTGPATSPAAKARFHRQALHAQTLGFVHPLTGQDVHVEAPLPPDLDRPDRRPPQPLWVGQRGGIVGREPRTGPRVLRRNARGSPPRRSSKRREHPGRSGPRGRGGRSPGGCGGAGRSRTRPVRRAAHG